MARKKHEIINKNHGQNLSHGGTVGHAYAPKQFSVKGQCNGS